MCYRGNKRFFFTIYERKRYNETLDKPFAFWWLSLLVISDRGNFYNFWESFYSFEQNAQPLEIMFYCVFHLRNIYWCVISFLQKKTERKSMIKI